MDETDSNGVIAIRMTTSSARTRGQAETDARKTLLGEKEQLRVVEFGLGEIFEAFRPEVRLYLKKVDKNK